MYNYYTIDKLTFPLFTQSKAGSTKSRIAFFEEL